MSSPQRPAAAGTDAAPAPASEPASEPASDAAPALAAAIAQAYPGLQKTAAVYVWRAGLARSREHAAELADEVLADAVARALERADRWRPDIGTHPWIARFAAHVVLERQRSAGQAARRFVRPDDDAHPGGDPLEQLLDPATLGRDQLFELLDLVPEPDRSLLRRAYVDHEPQVEIARGLGITHGALRVRLTRAKQRFTRAYHAAERGEKGARR